MSMAFALATTWLNLSGLSVSATISDDVTIAAVEATKERREDDRDGDDERGGRGRGREVCRAVDTDDR